MTSNGLRDVGYEYINVDGGWWAGSDTGTVERNTTGFVTWNAAKYPRGIPALVEHIHSLGLKYGHYTDAGTHACNGDKPMSEGYEWRDAALFAEWGVDMLKVDACGVRGENHTTIVARWRAAIENTSRPMLFSNCHNGCQTDTAHSSPPGSDWLPGNQCSRDANMWRSSRDISGTWASVLYNLDALKGRGAYAAPHQWNDPDFLEVHLGEFRLPSSGSLDVSLAMNRAHYAMWCITSSPLILGFDMPAPPEIMAIVTNKAAIAVNQQYASGSGSAGDLIRALHPSASSPPSPQPPPYPPHPFPALEACESGTSAQAWALNTAFNGSICERKSTGSCFNVQDCKSDLILYTASSHGHGCGNNMEFELLDGLLRSRLAGRASSCVVPGGAKAQFSASQLRLGDCNVAAHWAFDSATGRLAYTSSGATRCLTAKPKPRPTPTPVPPPASADVELWAKPLPGNTAAVAVLNRGSAPAHGALSFTLAELPGLPKGATSCTATDVWSSATRTVGLTVTVPAVLAKSAEFLVLSGCT